MDQAKTFFELEAGSVPYKINDSELKFLVIYREKLNDYSFPKGHVETGESLEQAALREIKEESGFNIKLEQYLHSFEYKVKEKLNGEYVNIIRRVYVYLSRMISGSEAKNNPDINEGKISIVWLNYKEVLENLTYDADKELVQKAYAVLNQKNTENTD